MGSNRGGNIVTSFGPVAVVPSKPGYSAHVLSIPYTLDIEGDFCTVQSFTPALLENFTVQFKVNDITTDEYYLGPQTYGFIDGFGDGDCYININYASKGNTFEIFLAEGSNYVINKLEVYINGEKVNLIQDESI